MLLPFGGEEERFSSASLIHSCFKKCHVEFLLYQDFPPGLPGSSFIECDRFCVRCWDHKEEMRQGSMAQ